MGSRLVKHLPVFQVFYLVSSVPFILCYEVQRNPPNIFEDAILATVSFKLSSLYKMRFKVLFCQSFCFLLKDVLIELFRSSWLIIFPAKPHGCAIDSGAQFIILVLPGAQPTQVRVVPLRDSLLHWNIWLTTVSKRYFQLLCPFHPS